MRVSDERLAEIASKPFESTSVEGQAIARELREVRRDIKYHEGMWIAAIPWLEAIGTMLSHGEPDAKASVDKVIAAIKDKMERTPHD